MDTKTFTVEKIAEAAKLIHKGELVAFPTETVYGLGADARNAQAVQKVFLAKGRPSDNPLIVHLSCPEMLFEFVDNFSEKAKRLVENFWPGSLTIVFPVKKNALPKEVTSGLSTAAFRMPNNEVTLNLIKMTGPLVGPSANTSGKPSPTSSEHVLHDLNGKIAGVIDGGSTQVGLESTVIDLSDEKQPVILRPGAVTKEEIEAIIGSVEFDKHLFQEEETPKSPGMKYKHYAPNAIVYMIKQSKENWEEAIRFFHNQGKKVGILSSKEIFIQIKQSVEFVYILSEENQVEVAAQNLFSGLRLLDEKLTPEDIILVQTYADFGIGVAYMNRLRKAADQKYF